ncbi:MAG: SRPBCC domain-containing protein [Rhodocyclaceae bacterium]|nr:SRPBCC domain-containing protein [Rhodocyclaceae bacterium]
MDQKLPTFVAHPSDHEIVISRVFDAPRELVFKAWTDPRHVMAWWGPHGFENTECALDLRVGGSFFLSMTGPDGKDYPCRGTYEEIVAPARIRFSGIAEDGHACGAGLPPYAMVTVDFAEEENGKTRLTINTRMPNPAAKTAAAQGGYVVGWTESLDRLAHFIAPHH